MEIQSFTFSPFMTNCYVLHSEGRAAVVDPSCESEEEREAVVRYLEENELAVDHLLLTHAHVDHIFGCRFFEEREGMAFQMHEADLPLIEEADRQAQAFGVRVDPPSRPEAFLAEGDTVELGAARLEVLHTPGHSPGSITFVEREARRAISGDVLFQNSIGRTQGLPQTSHETLIRSIVDKLLPLGDDVAVYPGHGPSTTIGRERENNPFLQQAAG
jgi:glyoxylase-like metal-dependent hydrolase (beta-lactamase superfamily II)